MKLHDDRRGGERGYSLLQGGGGSRDRARKHSGGGALQICPVRHGQWLLCAPLYILQVWPCLKQRFNDAAISGHIAVKLGTYQGERQTIEFPEVRRILV